MTMLGMPTVRMALFFARVAVMFVDNRAAVRTSHFERVLFIEQGRCKRNFLMT